MSDRTMFWISAWLLQMTSLAPFIGSWLHFVYRGRGLLCSLLSQHMFAVQTPTANARPTKANWGH